MQKLFSPFRLLAVLLLSGLLMTATSCKDDDDDVTPTTRTLYERLGGINGVSAVVDQFLTNVVAESGTPTSQLKRTFQPLLTDVTTNGNSYRLTLLRNNLIDQIGEAAGGPLVYKGKSMALAHQGMMITDAEFNALVTALQSALTTKQVPTAEQTELINVLAGLKGQIVGQ